MHTWRTGADAPLTSGQAEGASVQGSGVEVHVVVPTPSTTPVPTVGRPADPVTTALPRTGADLALVVSLAVLLALLGVLLVLAARRRSHRRSA